MKKKKQASKNEKEYVDEMLNIHGTTIDEVVKAKTRTAKNIICKRSNQNMKLIKKMKQCNNIEQQLIIKKEKISKKRTRLQNRKDKPKKKRKK